MGMDIFGVSGAYFCANIWSWRALRHAMDKAGYDVPLEWSANNGYGLSSQEDCDELADLLCKFLSRWDGETFVMESDTRVDETGKFVDEDTPGSISAYTVSRDRIEAFIDFLRNCGGTFQIF
jgi:hypothetical protein